MRQETHCTKCHCSQLVLQVSPLNSDNTSFWHVRDCCSHQHFERNANNQMSFLHMCDCCSHQHFERNANNQNLQACQTEQVGQVGLLVACKRQLGPLLHVCDPDQLLPCWRSCRPDSWHHHLLVPLERPAPLLCLFTTQKQSMHVRQHPPMCQQLKLNKLAE